ncbi:MAG: murein L,D-transpeptidase family protein [Alphaproteobacteria bacterium]
MRGSFKFFALAVILMSTELSGGQPARANELPPMSPVLADKILVVKSQRKLYLLKQGQTLRTYNVALGYNPNGPKTTEWDGKTPEGMYSIDMKHEGSQFHLALRVSYPNAADKAQAAARGVKPGDDIFIHGEASEGRMLGWMKTRKDWTEGCIGVTNAEIREIWSFVKAGTPIEIRP